MAPRFRLVGVGLLALFGASSPAVAGGPGVGIEKLHGTAEIRPLGRGARWRRAKPGELTGAYLLRTGPRSWAHLREYGAPKPESKGCVDARSLLRIRSNCGYRIEVLRGKVSAADGKQGKSLFKVASL
jgi:hypothetical protein